ncbi:hypothetical protein [Nocardia sp. NPDC004604]
MQRTELVDTDHPADGGRVVVEVEHLAWNEALGRRAGPRHHPLDCTR